MNGIPNRVVRLVTLVSVAAVSILGSTQAMAAAPINYYQGSANGTALAVAANPDAVLNVKLAAINAIVTQLEQTTGLNLSAVHGTLTDATKSINVVIDQAHSAGTSAAGQQLTGGTSTTTPLSIDAASLNGEIDAIKAALQDIPAGAVGQLNTILGTLPSSNNLTAVTTALTQLGQSLSATLGHPAVNAFDTATANFGQTPNPVNEGNLVAGPSFLSTGPFVLGPFSAEALPKDAAASNTLTSLDLVPTGNISIPSDSQLGTLLNTIGSAIQTLEQALGATVTPVTTVIPGLGTVITTITAVVNPTYQTIFTNLNNGYATLVGALHVAFDALGVTNGLQLNDLLGTGPSTASSTLSRDLSTANGSVSANGLSEVAHVDVLKLTNPILAGLINSVSTAAGGSLPANLANTSLVSVDAIKGVAAVTANGSDPMTESYSGSLLDVSVLGQSLKAIAGQAGAPSLDAILPPGSVCTIQVPGKITCTGLQNTAVETALGALNSVLGAVPTNLTGLITITLTRGANSTPGLNSGTPLSGKASIVTLEVNATVDCAKVAAILPVGTLNTALNAAGISLCANAAGNNAATSNTRTAHATSAPAGSSSLVDVQLGAADSALSLTSAATLPGNCTAGSPACPLPPNTGNNMLILAAFGLILAAAGIGINRLRVPVRG